MPDDFKIGHSGRSEARTGIHNPLMKMDSCFRGNDGELDYRWFPTQLRPFSATC